VSSNLLAVERLFRFQNSVTRGKPIEAPTDTLWFGCTQMPWYSELTLNEDAMTMIVFAKIL